MSKMLASVTSVAEANIVLNEDVDIVDLKNPIKGALGALDIKTVTKVVKIVKANVLTSATIGDVEPNAEPLSDLITEMADTGIDIVKVGLFAKQPTDHFFDVISKAAKKNIRLVIVLFAENYMGNESFESLLNTGINGLMLDTKNKNGKNLKDILHKEQLKYFVDTVKSSGLLSGLAGSLRLEDVDSLLKIRPDYLGFRGALCSENNRINNIDPVKIKGIRDIITHKERY